MLTVACVVPEEAVVRGLSQWCSCAGVIRSTVQPSVTASSWARHQLDKLGWAGPGWPAAAQRMEAAAAELRLAAGSWAQLQVTSTTLHTLTLLILLQPQSCEPAGHRG